MTGKDGKKKNVKLDKSKNLMQMSILREVLVNRDVEDMFYDIKYQGNDMKQAGVNVGYQFRRKFMEMILSKLKLLLGLKLVSGSIFLKAVLMRIEITKQLFVAEVE